MEVKNDRKSKNFGMLMERVKKFPTFAEAVSFSRVIANTSINMVGKPVIEEVNMAGHKD
jgi:hypothetical protein